MRVEIVALLVHGVLLAAVFDIYFRSPLERGLPSHVSPLPPPARRLVLFVADGLRADSLFTSHDEASFLRNVTLQRGVWGISHTRVPTESRPGHVALIAGLYEDPSAIAKGWKENPVEFDSVFNQSRETWSWGSPDILPMFAKGATGNHVWTDMYDAEEEDFSGQENTTNLDIWVFDRVRSFLHDAKADPKLTEHLMADRIIFFLHLLGLDTAGHTYKPQSSEYLENIHVVDKGVAEMEMIFEDFYNHDQQTAYIFTSDHGMTDWGSHGAGDAAETETPLLVWGAGIGGPRPPPSPSDERPKMKDEWGLSDVWRRDVAQADVAPLMATLIGTSLPVNNVGTLPCNYLNIPEHTLAEAILANARQIAELYVRKRLNSEMHTPSWLYKPFTPLEPDKDEEFLQEIHTCISNGQYQEAVNKSQHLITLLLEGVSYHEAYLRPLLLVCASLAFVAWISLLVCHVALPTTGSDHPLNRSGTPPALDAVFFCFTSVTAVVLWAQRVGWRVGMYCALPVALWWALARALARRRPTLRHLASAFLCQSATPRRSMGAVAVAWALARTLLVAAAIELLLAAFFWRQALAVALAGPLALWTLLRRRRHEEDKMPWILRGAWAVATAALAVFPALPVVGADANIALVQTSGALWTVAGCAIAGVAVWRSGGWRSAWPSATLAAALALATWNVGSVAQNLEEREGLPPLNQALSWTLTGGSLVLPLFSPCRVWLRMATLALGLAVPILLLSTRHEALFLLTLCLHSAVWLWLELDLTSTHASNAWKVDFSLSEPQQKVTEQPQPLLGTDFRRAYFFLFFVLLSFFGTGNIASLNSFDPTWVRCYVTVFSPFTMAALILCRTVLPFLAVTVGFRAQNVLMKVSPQRLFLLVLALCDILAVQFLHLVTNQGSWKRIGESLSHYIIVMAITLFVLLLYLLARAATGIQLRWPKSTSATGCASEQARSLESGEVPDFASNLCKRHWE